LKTVIGAGASQPGQRRAVGAAGHGTGVGNDNGSGARQLWHRGGGGRKLMVKRHGGSKMTEKQSMRRCIGWRTTRDGRAFGTLRNMRRAASMTKPMNGAGAAGHSWELTF